ncbi:hypothetical protein AYI70_g1394 [Smittium culicis]|uniref:Uncharacterized protein n=1 Tax=Smittium culicis TaxID=133412 RepID=A0A1R1YCS9_9FUNG|nr:hypothetical protein AYI70_g1394 [Smittium culicis]
MTLQDQKVNSTDQYTYLGYIINSKWDVSGTSKNKKNKVRKAVLMPIGRYGGEKFGMSEARCKTIQMEIDKAI